MTLELYVLTETRKDMHTFEQVNNRSHDVGTSFESTPDPLTVKQSFVHFYSKTINTDLHFPLAKCQTEPGKKRTPLIVWMKGG